MSLFQQLGVCCRLQRVCSVSVASYLSVEGVVLGVTEAADDARLQGASVDVHVGRVEPLVRLGVVTLHLRDGETSCKTSTEGCSDEDHDTMRTSRVTYVLWTEHLQRIRFSGRSITSAKVIIHCI